MEQIEKIAFTNFIKRIWSADSLLYQDNLLITDMHWLPAEEAVFHPIQLDAFTFVLVECGELIINIDYKPFRIKENTFFVLIERHIVQPVSASRDFRGYHLIASHQFVRNVTSPERPPLSGATLLPSRSNPAICLETAQFTALWDNLERLKFNIQRSEHIYQAKLVQNALADLLFEIWNFTIRQSGNKIAEHKPTPRNDIVAKFFDLLYKYGKREHDVAFYAGKLCVTPVFLSRAVKHVTGKPAIKIISDIVLTEARVLLHKPDATIQQIAEELNFADQASFSKFFKKNTGETPLKYRAGTNLK